MSRITDRLKGLETLKKIDKNKKDYFVIHYSCESFFTLGGKSPRISSIAVENLEFGQTDLFAIYKSAEEMNVLFDEIDNHYESLEKHMLTEYFQHLKSNQGKVWLHWNMRDSNFGFKALEHRFQVLGGTPISLPDPNQINIAELFKELYGPEYIEDKKMDHLMEKNNLKPMQYLTGKDEAKAFEEKKYYELSMSTSGKVRMFTNMINMAIDGTLKTNTSKKELYGLSTRAYWYRFTETKFFKPISYLVSTVIGAIIGHFVTRGL